MTDDKARAVAPQLPNPGSSEAVAQGCVCSRIDNHHGEGFPYRGGKTEARQ